MEAISYSRPHRLSLKVSVLAIWVSKEGIVPMVFKWEVGETSGKSLLQLLRVARIFLNVSECPKIFLNIGECYKIFQSIKEYSRKFPSVQNCCRMSHNIKKFEDCLGMLQNVLESPKKYRTHETVYFWKSIRASEGEGKVIENEINFSEYF